MQKSAGRPQSCGTGGAKRFRRLSRIGLGKISDDFDRRLRQAYDQARQAGLWKDKYAATNPHEYWAEGAQSWFDTNRPPDHDHNHVDTREELKEYDPRLAALAAEAFGDDAWRYRRPVDRKPAERRHLIGFDPQVCGAFAWPKELQKIGDEIRERVLRERREKASQAQ